MFGTVGANQGSSTIPAQQQQQISAATAAVRAFVTAAGGASDSDPNPPAAAVSNITAVQPKVGSLSLLAATAATLQQAGTVSGDVAATLRKVIQYAKQHFD